MQMSRFPLNRKLNFSLFLTQSFQNWNIMLCGSLRQCFFFWSLTAPALIYLHCIESSKHILADRISFNGWTIPLRPIVWSKMSTNGTYLSWANDCGHSNLLTDEWYTFTLIYTTHICQLEKLRYNQRGMELAEMLSVKSRNMTTAAVWYLKCELDKPAEEELAATVLGVCKIGSFPHYSREWQVLKRKHASAFLSN